MASISGLRGLEVSLELCCFDSGAHLPVTNVGGTNVAAVRSKVLGVDSRQRLVTETDVVEATHNLQSGEVVGEVELVGSVRGVEDEVEREGVWLVPVLLAGHDELLGTHLQSVFLLLGGVREDVDLSSESDSPHDSKVTYGSCQWQSFRVVL